MKKFNLSNLIFLIIMTLFGFILLPLEVILLALMVIYLPFEYLVFNVKYKYIFKKYKFLFFIRFKKTINIYKTMIEQNVTYIVYDENYRCFIVDNKAIIIKNGFKCEKTININLLDNLENKYSIKIED